MNTVDYLCFKTDEPTMKTLNISEETKSRVTKYIILCVKNNLFRRKLYVAIITS